MPNMGKDSRFTNGIRNVLTWITCTTATALLTLAPTQVQAQNKAPSFTIPPGVSTLSWNPTATDANRQWLDVAASGDATKLAAVVFGGYIYTSTDSGANWTEQTGSGLRAWVSIASSDDGVNLAAASRDGLIYTSSDSGVTWVPRAASGSRLWYSIASSDDGTKLVAVTFGGQIYTSIDSGANWTARESARNWYAVTSSADGTNLVAVVYAGQIYVSSDSGANWTPRDSNRSWVNVTSSSDGTKLAAVENGGKIYVSNDSGLNWTARASDTTWWAIDSSSDGSRLVAVVKFGQIWTSADFGANWTASETVRNWSGAAASNDGSKLVATNELQHIYTSTFTSAPLSITVAAHSGTNTRPNFASNISAGPGDVGQTVNFEVSNDNNSLFTIQPAIAANGTLTFTPGAPAGTAIVTVVAKDNGGTAGGGVDTSPPQTFTITVTNTSPSIARTNAIVTVNEGSLASNDGTFSDPEGNATVTLSASVGSVVKNNAGTWTWSYTPADGPTDTQVVTISANDGFNTAVQATFALNVNNVAPNFELGGNVSLPVATATYSATGIAFTDPGSDDWSTSTVDFGDGTGVQSLSVNGPARTFDLSHVFTTSGTFTVTVVLNDDDAGSLTDSITVTVALPPVVITQIPNPLRALKATLRASVNARGLNTTPIEFEFGTSSGVYTDTYAATPSPLSGSTPTVVGYELTGLDQLTTYYYRAKATNSAGTVYGDEITFTTPEAVPVLLDIGFGGNNSASPGSPVPGAPVGTTFHTFYGSPATGTASNFAVRGQFKHPTGQAQHALFLGTGPSIFVRGNGGPTGDGDAVPAALPGGRYQSFFDPVLNENNQIAFIATVTGGVASGKRAVFTNIPDGILKVLASDGSTFGPFTFGTPNGVSVAGEGVLFVEGTKLYGWENDQGTKLLFSNGQAVSANGTPKTVASFEFVTSNGASSSQGRSHVIDSDGNQKVTISVSFTDGTKGVVVGSITPGGAATGFDTTVVTTGELVDKFNTGAPMLAGATWSNSLFQKAGRDQTGKWFGFHTFIRQGTYGLNVVSRYNDSALFVDVAPGETILQVREGEQAAGTPAGITYKDFYDLSMGDSPSQYAFLADLRGPGLSSANDMGLWYKSSTGLKLALRSGSVPHGVGEATVKLITLFGQPAQGGLGVVATLAGGGVTPSTDTGFWAINSLGEVKLGLRKGQTVFAGGSNRTVGLFQILSTGLGASGASRSFNRAGFFSALINFTDGSQNIVEIEVP